MRSSLRHGIYLLLALLVVMNLQDFKRPTKFSAVAVDYAIFATDRALEAYQPAVILPHENMPVYWNNTGSSSSSSSSSNTSGVVCWKHAPIRLSTGQQFELPTATCGTLRRKAYWESRQVHSPLAKDIARHQSNCSLPTAVHKLGEFDVPGGFLFEVGYWGGLGFHLYLWSYGMCTAMEQGYRVQTYREDWLWLDQSYCDRNVADHKSPLLCYFPDSECRCNNNSITIDDKSLDHLPKLPAVYFKTQRCSEMRNDPAYTLRFRAAAAEYLFSKVSPLLLREAERQIGLLFPNGIVPKDIVVVHVRWGDKGKESILTPMEDYVKAVSDLLIHRNGNNETGNVYLLTEDPLAVRTFQELAPPGWVTYVERFGEEFRSVRPNYGNHASRTARFTKGRSGLVNLGGLLVAMEADNFVLTMASTWSQVIDDLRTSVLDPRCDNCTRMIDVTKKSKGTIWSGMVSIVA